MPSSPPPISKKRPHEETNNNNNKEDDDYMTMNLESFNKEPIPTTYTKRRQRHLQTQIDKTRSRSEKAYQNELREKGLQKPIGEENKGFQLLQKMGYK